MSYTSSSDKSSRSKSAQEKAEQLLQLADAVEQASHKKKLQLEEIQSRLADDDEEDENGTSQASLNESPELHGDEEEQQPTTNASSKRRSPDMTLNSGSGSMHSVTSHDTHQSSRTLTKSKPSKRKLIKELKEQLSSSHRALVTVQENAQLKLQKALLEKKDVEVQLKMKQDELKKSKETIKQLQQKVSKLELQLTSALGTDRVEWLIELETNQCRLLGDVDKLSEEKSAVTKERDELSAIVQECETCKTKVSSYVPPEEPKPQQQQSFWSGAKALFHLNELNLNDEAEATPAGVVVVASTATPLLTQPVKNKVPVPPQQQSPKSSAPRSSFLGAFTSRLSSESSSAATSRQTSVAKSTQQSSMKAADQQVNELRLALEQDLVSTRRNSVGRTNSNQRLQSNGSFRKMGSPRGSLDKLQYLRDSFRGSLRMLETEELHDDADIEEKVAKQIQSGAGANLLSRPQSHKEEKRNVDKGDTQDTKQTVWVEGASADE